MEESKKIKYTTEKYKDDDFNSLSLIIKIKWIYYRYIEFKISQWLWKYLKIDTEK